MREVHFQIPVAIGLVRREATCFTALLRRSTSNKNSIHSLER